MNYPRYIITNWFTIMGGIASALMYIQSNQTTCTRGYNANN